MSNDLWRWADPGGQQREVRLDELRAALAGGLIAPNTPVWKAGWPHWQPAHDVPELSAASAGATSGVVLNIPPPPLAVVALQQEYEAASESLAPIPAAARASEEPPPPPPYVPAASRAPSLNPSSSHLKTQLVGSANVPAVAKAPSGSSRATPAHAASQSPPRVSASLPTSVGVPPPPDVFAAKPAAPAKSSPPPVPKKRSGAPAPEVVEELSDSMLLDVSSTKDVTALGNDNAHADESLPPPTAPVVRDGSDGSLDEIAGLRRRPGLSLIIDDIAAIRRGQPPKNKLLVGVLGVLAFSLLIMFVAGIVSLARGPSTSEANTSAAASSKPTVTSDAPTETPAATTTAATTTTATTTTETGTPSAHGSSFSSCESAGDERMIAPRAVVSSAIEAAVLDDHLTFGFATSARDAVVISLDPSTLEPTATARTKSTGGDARRVTPMLVNDRLTAVADVDRKKDRIGRRRIVPTRMRVDVGIVNHDIVWSAHGGESFVKLFSVDGDAPIEALRAVPLTDREGIALTFRQGNTVHVGVATGEGVLETTAPLSKIDGLGQVGSPSITSSGDRVIVAWAERADADSEWRVSTASMEIGSSIAKGTAFTIPEGGLGDQAMSPNVSPLGGGRFLLAWTEGPVLNHQVRAIVMNEAGAATGKPIELSAPGMNAGQPSGIVGPDGRGAVAFFVARGKALELHATPIRCTAR